MGPGLRRPLCFLFINLMDGQRSFSKWQKPFSEYSMFPKFYKLGLRANAYEKLKVSLLYYLYIIIFPLRITEV